MLRAVVKYAACIAIGFVAAVVTQPGNAINAEIRQQRDEAWERNAILAWQRDMLYGAVLSQPRSQGMDEAVDEIISMPPSSITSVEVDDGNEPRQQTQVGE
jgi:hypothetical protein